MPAKRVQPMRIGCGDQWLAKSHRNFCRSAIRIEKPPVKMTDFNRIKAIDFLQEPRPNGAAKNIKWMRRYRKYRVSTPGAKLS
jgi:hypothetical protein